MKGLFQIIVGGVITLGGIALGAGIVISTGDVGKAVSTAGPVIATGVGIAGFSRTVAESVKSQLTK